MIITAKFASACPCCSVRIQPGTKVEWSKGEQARHATCASKPGAVSVASAPASTSATANAAGRRAARAVRQAMGDCRRYGWDGVHGSPSYYSSGQYDEES